MGFFNLAGMTFGGLFTKKETLKYPKQTKKPYAGQKGMVVNAKPSQCNLCGICSKKCPCGAIEVDKEKTSWAINRTSCIQCQYCIESCPKKCLIMKTEKPMITTKAKMDVTKIKISAKKTTSTSKKTVKVTK